VTSDVASSGPWSDDNRVIAYRAFLFDFNDDDFSGYATGEFLLLEDGVLFRRSHDWVADPSGGRWTEWKVDERWSGGPSVEAFTAWARGHGYELSYPDHGPE
jgi:hypothetical protein